MCGGSSAELALAPHRAAVLDQGVPMYVPPLTSRLLQTQLLPDPVGTRLRRRGFRAWSESGRSPHEGTGEGTLAAPLMEEGRHDLAI